MNLSTTMSVNILTVGGLNIQSQRLSGWGEKKSQPYSVYRKSTLNYKDINILKVKEWKIYAM